MTTHKSTMKLAERWAEKTGPGWTTYVWENQGWHWQIISPCRRFEASLSTEGGWHALHAEGSQWVGRGATPQGACGDWLRQAREEIDSIARKIGGRL